MRLNLWPSIIGPYAFSPVYNSHFFSITTLLILEYVAEQLLLKITLHITKESSPKKSKIFNANLKQAMN